VWQPFGDWGFYCGWLSLRWEKLNKKLVDGLTVEVVGRVAVVSGRVDGIFHTFLEKVGNDCMFTEEYEMTEKQKDDMLEAVNLLSGIV